MILKTLPPSWTEILRQNFSSLDALADFLKLSTTQRQQLSYQRPFPLNLPRRLAEKIAKESLNDPIFKQFVPITDEELSSQGFCPDPLQELQFRTHHKLLHKYQGRALLLCTSACAMHCRFCFRQHFPYTPIQTGFEQEIAILSADSSIQEVILSGGDPLSLSDRLLQQLLDALAAIPHLKRIRFHSRFPIGIPERINDTLCASLANLPQQVWFVLHANHPSEFDNDIFHHLSLLKKAGVSLLHQGVLLRDINDDAATLARLYEMLVDHGITPYYLHQLDRVAGASHFEVPLEKGQQIMKSLSTILSGYALPRYVREVAGAPSKVPIPY